MGSLWQQQAVFQVPPRSRIRAVVADFDEVRRQAVLRSLQTSQLYDIVGNVGSAAEFHELLRDEVPELALCAAAFLPQHHAAGELFPLYVALGTDNNDSGRFVGCIADHTASSQIEETLAAAASRVLTVKAEELSSLIHKYLEHSEDLPTRARSIAVEQNGVEIMLNISQVRWIKAAGNYVWLYSDAGTFLLRESIRRVFARLEPLGFVRVHRGAIVNVAAIHHQISQNGYPAALVLDDGTRIPVGPNFRDQVPDGTPVLPSTVVS